MKHQFKTVGGKEITFDPELTQKIETLVTHYRQTLLSMDEDVIEQLYQLRIVEDIDESVTDGIPNQPRHPNSMAGD